MEERFEGALLGAACGDALGAWTESYTPSAIYALYGGRLEDFPQNSAHPYLTDGTLFHFTDDTQLTLCVAESMAEQEGFDPRHIAMRMVEWSQSPDNIRQPSRTCMRATRNLRDGMSPAHSGVPSTCGAATARVVPIGLYYAFDEARCSDLARQTLAMTHRDSQVEAAAAAVSLAVAKLVSGTDPSEVFAAVTKGITPINQAFATQLAIVEQCLGLDDTAAFNCLGRSDSVGDVVASAFFAFLRHPDDFRETVLTAVNAGGKADSVACLAGALAGCTLGISAIPTEWLEQLEKADHLRSTARRLCNVAASQR